MMNRTKSPFSCRQSIVGGKRAYWRRRDQSEACRHMSILEEQQPNESMIDERSRVRIPFRSNWRRPSRGHDSKDDDKGLSNLQELEISTFQQLCMDKYDENAAFEMLLDPADSSNLPIYCSWSAASSESEFRAQSEMAAPVVGKWKLLDRFSFTSPGTGETPPVVLPATQMKSYTKENCRATSCQDSSKDRGLTLTTVPKAWNGIEELLRGESNEEWTATQKSCSGLLETHSTKTKGKTASNIRSLNSPRASRFLEPITINRHESLGMESIMDVRKCLKEMERQLSHASKKGKKVSRKKVIEALFTVADAIEDNEERDLLKTELETIMKTERDNLSQSIATKRLCVAADNEKSEHTVIENDDSTDSSSGFEEDQFTEEAVKDASSFNLMAPVGNLFGVNPANREAVEEVLDDLLWTEFVASRKGNRDSGSQQRNTITTNCKPRTLQVNKRKISLQIKHYEVPPRTEYDYEPNQFNQSRSRWRNRYHSASVGKSDVNMNDNDEDVEEESSSMSSEEFPSYLPTSITVNSHERNSPFTKTSSVSFSNSRYKVNHVDM